MGDYETKCVSGRYEGGWWVLTFVFVRGPMEGEQFTLRTVGSRGR